MKENMFLNKIDFTIPVSSIPNNDAGNLKLYRLLTLVRESYELKCEDESVGYSESLDTQRSYYNDIITTLNQRGLKVPRNPKSKIERVQLQVKQPPRATLYCPICGIKLSKEDVETYTCSNCYGRLPGYTDYIMQKPFASFENFDACIIHMTKPKSEGGQGYDMETAKRVCGSLQSEHEGKKSKLISM